MRADLWTDARREAQGRSEWSSARGGQRKETSLLGRLQVSRNNSWKLAPSTLSWRPFKGAKRWAPLGMDRTINPPLITPSPLPSRHSLLLYLMFIPGKGKSEVQIIRVQKMDQFVWSANRGCQTLSCFWVELGTLEMLGGERYESRKSWRNTKNGGWGSTEGQLPRSAPCDFRTSLSQDLSVPPPLNLGRLGYVASVTDIVSSHLTKSLLHLKVLASPSFGERCSLGFCDIIPFGSFLPSDRSFWGLFLKLLSTYP